MATEETEVKNKFNFDLDEYKHYVKLAHDNNKDIDIHLLEYIVASYLVYDKNGIEKPDENHPEFIKQNEKIKELIEQTKKIVKELDDRKE
jgi:replication initiation and membrane attachment protein DnaB